MNTTAPTPEMIHARTICLRAGEEARRRGDRRIGTEHVLLALFDESSIEGLLGVNRDRARGALDALDDEALAVVGLGSITHVPPLPTRPVSKRPRFTDVASRSRLALTPAAKKVLERAVKPNRRKTYVTAPQVLDQILRLPPLDPAAVLLEALGVDVVQLQRRLDGITPTK